METKSIVLFIALRNCFRDKMKFFVLIFGIAISIALIIITSTINSYIIQTQIESTKQVTGNWHVAYLLNDDSALSRISAIKDVKKVSKAFFIPSVKTNEYKENFNIAAINNKNLKDFITLNKGLYPTKKSEIIVPDWFLEKYSIKNFPYKINFNGFSMNIVGSFDADFSKTQSDMPVYISLESNLNLAKLSKPEIPWESMSQSKGEKKQTIHIPSPCYMALISLNPGCNISRVTSEIQTSTSKISNFPQKEVYSITDENSDNSACYNGELIGLQGFSGAGKLSTDGSFAAQNKLNTIFSCIIFALSAGFILTFFNIHKNDVIHQFGIFRAMGINAHKLILIQIVQTLLVCIISVPIGALLGILFLRLFVDFKYITMSSTIVLGIAINISIALLSSALTVFYSVINNPIISINKENSVKSELCVKKSRLIKSHGICAFSFQYALRNIWLHKKRFFYTTCNVALLFCLFTVFITTMNLYQVKGNGKSKYDSDVLIKLNEKADVPSTDFLNKIKSISEVKQVFSPTGYIENYASSKQKEVVVKIHKEAVTEIWKQKLLFSDPSDNIINNSPYIMTNTGILGCNKNELNYLQSHLVEGNIDIAKMADKPYVILPKYFEEYENENININNLKVGDEIQVCVTSEVGNLLNPTFMKTQNCKIAGFVNINPFKTSNGYSNQLSVIMHTNQLKELIDEPQIGYIYIKGTNGSTASLLTSINKLCLNHSGYTVINPHEDLYAHQREIKDRDMQNQLALLIMIAVSLIIFIGVSNVVFVQIALRKKEFGLLITIGVSRKTVRAITEIETLFFSIIGSLFGVGLSIIITKNINYEKELTNLILIPWNKWLYVAIGITAACGIVTLFSIKYLEKLQSDRL